ncbi:amidohydrolase family protein [Thiolapillus sp.]
MKTIDIHTHLLNPAVRFDRLFDRLVIPFFASSLGVNARALKKDPWETYVQAMARAVATSTRVRQTCLFAVDARVDRRGRELHRDGTVCADTADVLGVARRFPDQFIPFLSVNPLRPDALDRLEEHAANGCRGAKFLQNYWEVDLNDESLVPYYEKLAALKLPLVVHVGSELTLASKRAYEGADMLRLPLDCGVTVIAAHMGLGQIDHLAFPWRNLSKNPRWFDADYHRILELLETRENLYGDLSALLIPLRARALPHLASQTQIHHKLLFGSDYPVPFTLRFNTHGLPRADMKRIGGIANPFDRYASALTEFFPEDNPVWRNHQKVLPSSTWQPQQPDA